jgi:hypothetical protein
VLMLAGGIPGVLWASRQDGLAILAASFLLPALPVFALFWFAAACLFLHRVAPVSGTAEF